MHLISIASPFYSTFATFSWIALSVLVPMTDGGDLGRRLEVQLLDDDIIQAVILGIIGILCIHFIINIVYYIMLKVYTAHDEYFTIWKQKHATWWRFTSTMSILFSFNWI